MSKNMLNLKIDTVLEYYDNPQLLTARDCFDTLYLCLLYADEPECRYTGIKISNLRLLDFYNGKVDLRTLFLHPEGDRLYYDVCYHDNAYLMSLSPVSSISEERLPSEGYYMDSVEKECHMVNIPVKDHSVFKEIVKSFGWACM